MKEQQFTFQSELPFPVENVFAWHLRKGALERLIPPWMQIAFLFPPASPDDLEGKVGLKLKWGPFSSQWILKHRDFLYPQEFSDEQVKGFFRYYRHRHRFLSIDSTSCKLSDELTYALPFPFFNKSIRKKLSHFFSWRHRIISDDLKVIDSYPTERLRILLSGSSGLIGSHLKNFLQLAGHDVIRLVRRHEDLATDAIYWDPIHGSFCKEDFEGFDAVIHLAGEEIAKGRWTKNKKERLFLSRCRDTWLLSQVLCRLYRPPKTVLCASAIGYYGDRKEEILTEESSQGEGFLADLCGKWEKATEAIENRGVRVVHARFGAVLSAKGGMLKKIMRPFRLGLGGKLGSGKQWVSWISIDDLLGSFYHCLVNDKMSGPVNFVAPTPLIQADLARILAKRVGRPALVHLPASILKTVYGEMAEQLLLTSQNVKPEKLLKTGYTFRYPDLATALKFVM